MRKALLLFGHMRTFKQCFGNLESNLLKSMRFDVFMHTWDENESTTNAWHNSHMEVKKLSDAEKQLIVQLYQPTNIIFESQKIKDHDTNCPGLQLNAEGQKNMIKSMYMANELKKEHEKQNSFKYDMVLKLRPDIFLINNMMHLLFEHDLKKNNIFIAPNKQKAGEDLSCYRAMDIFGLSDSDTMNTVCELYHNFEEFYMKEVFDHSAFIDYLTHRDIDINVIEYFYGIDWIIKRQAKRS